MITRQFQLPALTDAAKDYAMRMLARHETAARPRRKKRARWNAAFALHPPLPLQAGRVIIRQGSPDISKLYVMTAGSVARVDGVECTDPFAYRMQTQREICRASDSRTSCPWISRRCPSLHTGSTSTASISGLLRRLVSLVSSPLSTARSGRPRRASRGDRVGSKHGGKTPRATPPV